MIGVAAPYILLLLACQDEISSDVLSAMRRQGRVGCGKNARPSVLESKLFILCFLVFARRRSAAVDECDDASTRYYSSVLQTQSRQTADFTRKQKKIHRIVWLGSVAPRQTAAEMLVKSLGHQSKYKSFAPSYNHMVFESRPSFQPRRDAMQCECRVPCA